MPAMGGLSSVGGTGAGLLGGWRGALTAEWVFMRPVRQEVVMAQARGSPSLLPTLFLFSDTLVCRAIFCFTAPRPLPLVAALWSSENYPLPTLGTHTLGRPGPSPVPGVGITWPQRSCGPNWTHWSESQGAVWNPWKGECVSFLGCCKNVPQIEWLK